MLAALLPVPLASATPYQGEPLSLNFQDVEVRSVLQVLADYAGVNLVVSQHLQHRAHFNILEVQRQWFTLIRPVSYTHLTLPTN